MKGTAGIDTSMVAFEGRTIISSRGRRSAADCAPLMICSSTGTLGGVNAALFMRKFVPFCFRSYLMISRLSVARVIERTTHKAEHEVDDLVGATSYRLAGLHTH